MSEYNRLIEKYLQLQNKVKELEAKKTDLIYFLESLLVEYNRDEVIKILNKYKEAE